MSDSPANQADGDAATRFVVLSTAPDGEIARRLADLLVRRRLAACVNVVAGVTSHYWWDGRPQCDQELLLVAKTDGLHLARVISTLEEEHPYDCPEVIALPVAAGSHAYLTWIATSLMEPPSRGPA